MNEWTKIRHKYCTCSQGLKIIDSLEGNMHRFSQGFCIPDSYPNLVKQIAHDLGYIATITDRWNVAPNTHVLVVRMAIRMRAKSEA